MHLLFLCTSLPVLGTRMVTTKGSLPTEKLRTTKTAENWTAVTSQQRRPALTHRPLLHQAVHASIWKFAQEGIKGRWMTLLHMQGDSDSDIKIWRTRKRRLKTVTVPQKIDKIHDKFRWTKIKLRKNISIFVLDYLDIGKIRMERSNSNLELPSLLI